MNPLHFAGRPLRTLQAAASEGGVRKNQRLAARYPAPSVIPSHEAQGPFPGNLFRNTLKSEYVLK